MAEPAFFTIRNWKKFQHYKHRNPPWVKLHVDILTSVDWVVLADASKLLAIACMVIAARHEGRVPNDPAYIKRVASIRGVVNFEPLIACGFLAENAADNSNDLTRTDNFENLQADASAEIDVLADASNCVQMLHQSTEYRGQKDTLTTVSVAHAPEATPPKKSKPKGTRLAEDWKPSERDRAYALERNLDDTEINAIANTFLLYWTGLDCPRPLKRDWPRTWDVWITNEAPKIIAGRGHGGRRSGGNVGYGASITAARDSILAKAGLRPSNHNAIEPFGLSADEHTQPAIVGVGAPSSGVVIDAVEWHEVPGPVERTEGADAPVTGNIDGPRSDIRGIPQASDDVSSRRGDARVDDAGEHLAVVASVAGTARAAGITHSPPSQNAECNNSNDIADELEIPAFMRREKRA